MDKEAVITRHEDKTSAWYHVKYSGIDIEGWDWDMPWGEDEKLSSTLKRIIESIHEDVGDIDIFVYTFVSPEIGFKKVPISIYLEHVDSDDFESHVADYILNEKINRRKTKRKEQLNEFEFLMIDED